MFRFKKSVDVSYDQQGYVYFVSRIYEQLHPWQQKKLVDLCSQAGGEYHAALFEFVTTDAGATEVCMRHHISRSTLERAVHKYYEIFPKPL